MFQSLSVSKYPVRGAETSVTAVLSWIIAVHFVVWTVGSAFYVKNLHYDTLELVFWGRDWMFGYGKHPPLATWVVDIATRLGSQPLLQVLVLGQICVAVSAYYIWTAARLFVAQGVALSAVLIFLASPAASYFSIQVNHNSLLMPFWCASLYFSLRHFQQPDWRSGLSAGVVAGLAMMVKYEVALLYLTLAVLAAVTPAYRRVFLNGGTWLGLGALALVLMPHLIWLAGNDWSTVSYALDARDVQSWWDVVQALNNTAVGLGILVVGPALWFGLARVFGFTFTLDRTRLFKAAILALGPPVLLIIGAILTTQNPRQGWFIVFIPNVALALALIVRPGRSMAMTEEPSWTLGLSTLLSVGQFVMFVMFLWLTNILGRPVLTFDLHASALANGVEEMWHDYESGPLRCVMINEIKIGGSSILALADRPSVVDLSTPFWSRPQRINACSKTGGIMIINQKQPGQLLKSAFPNQCLNSRTEISIPTHFGGVRNAQSVELVYVPPEAERANCIERDAVAEAWSD